MTPPVAAAPKPITPAIKPAAPVAAAPVQQQARSMQTPYGSASVHFGAPTGQHYIGDETGNHTSQYAAGGKYSTPSKMATIVKMLQILS
jgi:hypothetical protein